MKIYKNNKGLIVFKNENDEITQMLNGNQNVRIDPKNANYILISDFVGNRVERYEYVIVEVNKVTEVNHTTGSWTRPELMLLLEPLFGVVNKPFGDHISVCVEDEYELFVNFSNRVEAMLIKTTTTGNKVERTFVEQKAITLGDINDFWDNRANHTYYKLTVLP